MSFDMQWDEQVPGAPLHVNRLFDAMHHLFGAGGGGMAALAMCSKGRRCGRGGGILTASCEELISTIFEVSQKNWQAIIRVRNVDRACPPFLYL